MQKLKNQDNIIVDLKIVQEFVYNKLGYKLTELKIHSEGLEYGACFFVINGSKIEHRVSKITPKKIGQFVTIWKRNDLGITVPLDINDNFDFIIITVRSDKNFGQFIFPKSVLADNDIITINGKQGKRGIRVYPAWDLTKNIQATKTQAWQTKYFLHIGKDYSVDIDLLKQLLTLKI